MKKKKKNALENDEKLLAGVSRTHCALVSSKCTVHTVGILCMIVHIAPKGCMRGWIRFGNTPLTGKEPMLMARR